MQGNDQIISRDQTILITGANGFIGSRVVSALLQRGFTSLRCFVRPSSTLTRLDSVLAANPGSRVAMLRGNLLSASDCAKAVKDVAVILHLAAGIEKSFPGSFMNSVVTTRNLFEAGAASGALKRFVNVSSFAVYSNWNLRRGGLLDEHCELESHPIERAEAYAFAKLRQEQLVTEYGSRMNIPYVILRPGAVYGPGAQHITGRVGIATFGPFFHLGGRNILPLTYVDNCADAIVLAGIKAGIDNEAFNIVDDDLPTSRKFLRLYKQHAHAFHSVFIPYRLFYAFCWLWERYAIWSKGQLPPVFNRRRCAAYWKGNTYINRKLKERTGWMPLIPFSEASRLYFADIRRANKQC